MSPVIDGEFHPSEKPNVILPNNMQAQRMRNFAKPHLQAKPRLAYMLPLCTQAHNLYMRNICLFT